MLFLDNFIEQNVALFYNGFLLLHKFNASLNKKMNYIPDSTIGSNDSPFFT